MSGRTARPGRPATGLGKTFDAIGDYVASGDLPSWLIEFLEQLPIGVFIVDKDGRSRFANRAAERILGRRIRPEILPDGLHRAYAVHLAGTDEPYPALRSPLLRALHGERSTVDDVEIAHGGRRVRVRVWGAPLLDSSGRVAFAMAAFHDITAEKLLEAVFQEESRVTERGRIAEEIHDDVLQLLTAATLRLGAMRRHTANPVFAGHAESIESLVHQAIVRLRTILAGLKPRTYDSRPLAESIRGFLEPLARTGVNVTVEDHLIATPPELVRLAVERVFQEAVVNITKHARPTQVAVTLDNRDGGFLISMRDDGVGFDKGGDAEPGHIGLELMRERISRVGGSLRVESSPDHGTSVAMWVPDTSPLH